MYASTSIPAARLCYTQGRLLNILAARSWKFQARSRVKPDDKRRSVGCTSVAVDKHMGFMDEVELTPLHFICYDATLPYVYVFVLSILTPQSSSTLQIQ